MASKRSITFFLNANIKNFSENLNKAQKKFSKWGRDLNRSGKKWSTNVTGPLLLASGAVLKLSADFDTSMTKINTLVGISAEKVNQMKGSVIALSNQTGRSSKELSEALFTVTSAGLRGAKAMEVLELSAKAAATGLGSTQQIAKATTAVIQSYGAENISASEATDVLLRTVREGNLEASSLAPVLGKVTGIASQLGISFSEVGANIATFTRLGGSAEEAVTTLRGVMNSLIKPSEAGKKALGEVGLSFDDLRKKVSQDGLASTLQLLTDKFDGNMEGLSQVIPSVEALSNVMGTAGAQGESYTKIVDSITNSNEGLDKAFEDTAKTVGHRFTRSLQKLTNIGIKLGDKLMPVFEKLLSKVEVGIDWFSSLSDEAVTFGLAIAGIASTIGPALVVLGTLSAAIGAISLPIVGTIAALGALAAGVMYVADNFEALKERFSDITWWRNAIIDMAQFLIEYSPISMMIKAFNKMIGYFDGTQISNPFENTADKLELLKGKTKEYKTQLGSFNDAIKNGFKTGMDWVLEKFNSLGKKTDQVREKLENPIEFASTGDVTGQSVRGSYTIDVDLSKFEEVPNKVGNITDKIVSKWDQFKVKFKKIGTDFKQFLSGELSSAVLSFGEALGKSLAGADNQWQTTFEKIMMVVLDFAGSLAKLAAGIGSVLVFIPGMQGAGVGLLAAGLALQAISSGVKASIQKKASRRQEAAGMATGGIVPEGYPNDTYAANLTSGEMVIPPKKLPDFGGGGLSEDSMTKAFSRALAGARLKASGSDLALVLNNVGSTYR